MNSADFLFDERPSAILEQEPSCSICGQTMAVFVVVVDGYIFKTLGECREHRGRRMIRRVA